MGLSRLLEKWGEQAGSRTGLPGPPLSAHSSDSLSTARLQDVVGAGGETEARGLEAAGLTRGHAETQGQSSDGDVGISSGPSGAASPCPRGCFSVPYGAGIMAARTPLVPPVSRDVPGSLSLQLHPRRFPTESSPAFDVDSHLSSSYSGLSSTGGGQREASWHFTVPASSVW